MAPTLMNPHPTTNPGNEGRGAGPGSCETRIGGRGGIGSQWASEWGSLPFHAASTVFSPFVDVIRIQQIFAFCSIIILHAFDNIR
jgi:hypothetical protein